MDAKSTDNIFRLDPTDAAARVASLSPQQREVAEHIAHGVSREDTAKKMGIAAKTVDVHIAKVREKLSCTTNGIGRVYFCAVVLGE